MAIDKDLLVELYSISLEEARNHMRLYTQTWIAAAVITGVAFGALVSLFREPSFVLRGSIMWTLIGIGSLLGLGFYHSIAYHSVEARNCRGKAKEIGLILAGKTQDETPKLEELLITQVMREFRSPRESRVYAVLVDPPWRLFWLFMPIGLWIFFCLLLGGYIG